MCGFRGNGEGTPRERCRGVKFKASAPETRTWPRPPRSAPAASSQRTSLSGPRSCRVSARRRGGAPGAADGIPPATRGLPPPRHSCDKVTACREGAPFPSGVGLGRSRVSACFCVFVSACADSDQGNSAGSDFRLCGGPPVATSRRHRHKRAKGLGPTLTGGGSVKSPSVGPRGPSLVHAETWTGSILGESGGGRRRPPHVSEGDVAVPGLTQVPVFPPLLPSSCRARCRPRVERHCPGGPGDRF